jgi:hypothetical protein
VEPGPRLCRPGTGYVGSMSIYLCGAALITVAAVLYEGGKPVQAIVAGLVWPVIVVGMAHVLVMYMFAELAQIRVAHNDARYASRPPTTSAGRHALP